MNRPWRHLIVVLCGLALFGPGRQARGEKPVPSADLAFDQLSLKGGPRLLGLSLGRRPDGKTMFIVRREWLKKAQPKFLQKAEIEEAAETKSALTDLTVRIAQWRKDRNPDRLFQAFLDEEQARVKKTLADIEAEAYVEAAPFLYFEFPIAKVEKFVNYPPPKRLVALSAWREQLTDVESRSATNLDQQLKKQQANLSDDLDWLLDSLAPRRDSEAQWTARQAIVEYRFRKPLDFQGTGDLVIRAGENGPALAGAELLQQLLKSMAGNSLQELLEPDLFPRNKDKNSDPANSKWLATASKIAQADGIRGLRVTFVEPDLDARTVAVETRFMAQMPDGSWKTAWQFREQTDASKARPETEKQIEQDPQVQKVFELVKSIGLGAEDQIKSAIRFGAATMDAQKIADSQFYQFRDNHLRRLDGPMLPVPW